MENIQCKSGTAFSLNAVPRVLVCVLCGPAHWIWPDLMLRLVEASRTPDVDVEVRTVFGVRGYDNAMNHAVGLFLQSGAEFLCLIDHDTVPPVDFVPRVLDFAQSRSGVDIVALPVYVRPPLDNPTNLLLNVGWESQQARHYNLQTQIPSGWTEIDVGGNACMFIRRAVFSRLGCNPFRTPDHTPDATADFDFCEQAKAAGFRIWTNYDLLCGHLNTLDLREVAKAVAVRAQEDVELIKELRAQQGRAR
jgi:hypothetical protein